jgi:hypothetical protein
MVEEDPATNESLVENGSIRHLLGEPALDTRFHVDRSAFVVTTPQDGPRTSRLATNDSVSMPESFSST